MSQHSFDIVVGAGPSAHDGAQVFIDDHDVTTGVRVVSMEAGVDRLTTLTFTLNAKGRLSGEGDVVLDDATRDLLIAFGWIPPEVRLITDAVLQGVSLNVGGGPADGVHPAVDVHDAHVVEED